MNIAVNFIETELDIFPEEKSFLNKVIKEHATIAGKILIIPRINITVYPKLSWTIPETGESGYAFSEDWIRISVDTKSDKFSLNDIIKEHIPATIYHEMNHSARFMSAGYGNSLVEAIVSEGLATVFAKEQWASFISFWNIYSEREQLDFLRLFGKRDRSKDRGYNHEEWFYGKGRLPKWIGYKIGTYIIESVRNKFPKTTWKELVDMKAGKIVKMSGTEI